MEGILYGCWGVSPGSLGRCRHPYMDGEGPYTGAGSLYMDTGVPTRVLGSLVSPWGPYTSWGAPIWVQAFLYR